MWQKGQPWRVVKALDRLNTQIREACPRAVPPATDVRSWGSIANDEHESTSDHYPHYYSALGATAVVCARDFPHAPDLGLDAHAVAEAIRLSRDSRVGYVISNRRITGPNHSWRWDPYGGDDPHDTHIHVSSVHTAIADNTRDWQIGVDMPLTNEDGKTVWATDIIPSGDPNNPTWGAAWAMGELLRRAARVEAYAKQAAGIDLDEDQIVQGVLAGFGSKDPQTIVAALKAVMTPEQALAVGQLLVQG